MRKRLIICYLVFVANLYFLRNAINTNWSALLAFAAAIKTSCDNGNGEYYFFHTSNVYK